MAQRSLLRICPAQRTSPLSTWQTPPWRPLPTNYFSGLAWILPNHFYGLRASTSPAEMAAYLSEVSCCRPEFSPHSRPHRGGVAAHQASLEWRGRGGQKCSLTILDRFAPSGSHELRSYPSASQLRLLRDIFLDRRRHPSS